MRILLVALPLVALAGCASPPPREIGDRLPVHPLTECPGVSGEFAPADIVLAIDTSRSTVDATGLDLDGDGKIAQPEIMGATGAIFDVDITDPDDSFLAAEIIGVRSVIHGVADAQHRFAIVEFAGVARRSGRKLDATIEEPLTSDARALEVALSRIFASGSAGVTQFEAAVRTAAEALPPAPGDTPARPRIVLLISDTPRSTPLRSKQIFEFGDPKVREEASRAAQSGIVFHTFGIGEAAAAPRPHELTRIAEATGGSFSAVEDPTRIHCALARSISD